MLEDNSISHIGTYATSITNPNRNLLKGAAEIAAEEEQGKVYENTQVYEYRKASQQTVMLAIETPALPSRLGIDVDRNQKLCFIGDSYGKESAWDRTSDLVKKNYNVLAMRAGVASKGWDQTTEENPEGQPKGTIRMRVKIAA